MGPFRVGRRKPGFISFIRGSDPRAGGRFPFSCSLRVGCAILGGDIAARCAIGGANTSGLPFTVNNRPTFGYPLRDNREFRSCSIGFSGILGRPYLHPSVRDNVVSVSGQCSIISGDGRVGVSRSLFASSTVIFSKVGTGSTALSTNNEKIQLSCRSFRGLLV